MADPGSQELFRCLNGQRDLSNLMVASTALFFFDYFLTLHDEVVYVWRPRRRVTVGSTLFFVARYPALVAAILTLLPSSVVLEDFTACLRIVVITTAEVILAFRTWAVWEKSRRMLIFLCCLTVAALIPVAVVAQKDISTSHFAGTTECGILVSSAKGLWAVPYAMVIVYEAVNLALTLYKLEEWRKSIPVTTRSPLVDILWRDGVMYFFFMLGFGIVNIGLVIQTTTPQLRLGASQLQTCFHSILVSRTVVHLAKTYAQSIPSSLGVQDVLFTSLRFAHTIEEEEEEDIEEGRRTEKSEV